MFQEIYNNPWIVTGAVSAISFVGMGLWLRRGTFLSAYLALFTTVIIADALRSGSWSPLQLLHSDWESEIGLLFLLVGDFRYFLLVERFAWRPDVKPREATAPPAVLTAIVVMTVVPLIALFMQHVSTRFDSGQPLFLLWEALFVTLATVYRIVLPHRVARAPAPVRKWLVEVTHFELLIYGLWIVADVILLTGHAWGFALRIVPNVLYYGFFLLLVAHRAPPEVTE